MIEQILEKSKGRKGCTTCDGKGSYMFDGCHIFCVACHGEEGVRALWSSIDALLSKKGF